MLTSVPRIAFRRFLDAPRFTSKANLCMQGAAYPTTATSAVSFSGSSLKFAPIEFKEAKQLHPASTLFTLPGGRPQAPSGGNANHVQGVPDLHEHEEVLRNHPRLRPTWFKMSSETIIAIAWGGREGTTPGLPWPRALTSLLVSFSSSWNFANTLAMCI